MSCVIRIDRRAPVKCASFIATEPELEGLKEPGRARAGLNTHRIPDEEQRDVDPQQRKTKAVPKKPTPTGLEEFISKQLMRWMGVRREIMSKEIFENDIKRKKKIGRSGPTEGEEE